MLEDCLVRRQWDHTPAERLQYNFECGDNVIKVPLKNYVFGCGYDMIKIMFKDLCDTNMSRGPPGTLAGKRAVRRSDQWPRHSWLKKRFLHIMVGVRCCPRRAGVLLRRLREQKRLNRSRAKIRREQEILLQRLSRLSHPPQKSCEWSEGPQRRQIWASTAATLYLARNILASYIYIYACYLPCCVFQINVTMFLLLYFACTI